MYHLSLLYVYDKDLYGTILAKKNIIVENR